MSTLKKTIWTDQPRDIRSGEEFPVDRLQSFLGERLPNFQSPLELKHFPGGYSNLTYLVRSGEHEYVLRRPPHGTKIKSAHDMGREFKILSCLTGIYKKIPEPLLYCDDESVIGAHFYLMERVKGLILRKNLPPGMEVSPAEMKRLSQAFIDNLVEIHSVDLEVSRLNELGHSDGYIERQISGWTSRYLKAKTADVPEMESVSDWLAQNRPSESGTALIHNDYKYDNLVLNPESIAEIRAVLDWEMATVGDPLMDLGCTLSYWVDRDDPPELQALRFCPTTLPGNFTRSQLVQSYFAKIGRPERDMLFYYVYGLFKLAVIVQQIFARYAQGFTKDPRFAELDRAVKALAVVASRAIQKKRIDRLS